MPVHYNGLFLAPLAGISETVFRKLCREHGADVVISEMVSAEGLLRSGKQTLRLLRFDESERPLGVQLFGADPDRMAAAAAMVEALAKPDFIDLNAGCPVSKVVRRNAGAALLRDPGRFERMAAAMARAIRIPLTVKLRSGWNSGEWVDTEFARRAEASGAAAVTLHPRSKTMMFSGAALWERIAFVKNSVTIPVIGNGDVRSAGDAVRMKRETGCDGVMVGRGSFGSPWIFGRIKLAAAGAPVPQVTDELRLSTLLRHLRESARVYGERLAVRHMRKHTAWYLRGTQRAGGFRDRVFRALSIADLETIAREALEISA